MRGCFFLLSLPEQRAAQMPAHGPISDERRHTQRDAGRCSFEPNALWMETPMNTKILAHCHGSCRYGNADLGRRSRRRRAPRLRFPDGKLHGDAGARRAAMPPLRVRLRQWPPRRRPQCRQPPRAGAAGSTAKVAKTLGREQRYCRNHADRLYGARPDGDAAGCLR